MILGAKGVYLEAKPVFYGTISRITAAILHGVKLRRTIVKWDGANSPSIRQYIFYVLVPFNMNGLTMQNVIS